MPSLKTIAFTILLAPCLAYPNLWIWQNTKSYTSLGCYIDLGGNGRALTGNSVSNNQVIVESCASFCSEFAYFGLEYGSQCWCGDTCVEPNCSPTVSTDCDFHCAGKNSEICGAGNRLSLYTYNSSRPDSSSDVVAPSGWDCQGCYIDDGNPRVLPDNLLGDDAMTPDMCAPKCANYAYFGLEYGRGCWCGPKISSQSTSESFCSFPCAGDSSNKCGANGLMNSYAAESISTSVTATTSLAVTTTAPI